MSEEMSSGIRKLSAGGEVPALSTHDPLCAGCAGWLEFYREELVSMREALARADIAEGRVEFATADLRRQLVRIADYRRFAQEWRELLLMAGSVAAEMEDEPSGRPVVSFGDRVRRHLVPDEFGGERLVQDKASPLPKPTFHCGSGCVGGLHTYSSALGCLMGMGREAAQELRHPPRARQGHREAGLPGFDRDSEARPYVVPEVAPRAPGESEE